MSDDDEILSIDTKWNKNEDGYRENTIDKSLMNEILVFNPYNPNNKMITRKDISRILQLYNIPDVCHNLKIYQRAFVHCSYTKCPEYENKSKGVELVERPVDCLPLKTKSNERLEFIGDGVLECIVKYYLYRRFPKATEGFMTEKKIMLVKNETIGKFAYEIGLNQWYIISRHAEEKGLRNNYKKLGCLFEAFLGSIFLDFNKISIDDEWFKHTFMVGPGFQMCQVFVENVLEKHVNWNDIVHQDDNYKNIIQVKIQKHFKQTPYYVEWGYDADEGYDIGVYIGFGIDYASQIKSLERGIELIDYTKHHTIDFDTIIPNDETEQIRVYELSRSKHKIKKKAEQEACKDILERLI